MFGLGGRDLRDCWLGRHDRGLGLLQFGLSRLGLSRLGLAEQLVPLDEGADTQGQQGYAADADREVHQHQPAGHNPGDQQSDRNSNEKRAEPDHERSLSVPRR
jgi:hypothetical protein